MLKIIARTLAILCVCGLIAAVIYALVKANPSVGLRGEMHDASEFRPQPGAEGGFNPQGGPPQRIGHEGKSESNPIRGLAGVFGNFLLIAVLTLAVATAQRLPARLFGPARGR